jgi:hypothetical protein
VNALVRVARGLAHGVMNPVARPSSGVVALGGGCPCHGCGVATSATMVGSGFLRDGGGREQEEVAAATKAPGQLEDSRR